MANRGRVLVISLILVIIISSQGLNAQEVPELDRSKVGVKDGDSFTYVVLWNSAFNPEFPPMTTWNQEVGAEYTINIVNATLIYEKSWDITIPDRNYMQTEIEFENGTVQEETSPGFGNWIVFPDWDYWEFEQTELVNAIPSSEYNTTYEVSSLIDNGPEVFTSRVNINTTTTDYEYGSDYTTYRYTELQYDKATGMLLYLVTVYDHTTQDGRQLQYIEIAYVQKGYEDFELPPKVAHEEISSTDDPTSSSLTNGKESKFDDPTDTSLIPSFSFIISFTSLIATFTVIRYKKY